ncbi:MAG: O-methyltransferase [Planctomycetota bacterium]|nr:O-methyltransferase [Planctomycetota bacterium]
MSKHSTVVGPELFEFIAARTIPEDSLLADLRKASYEAGLPEIHIAPEQAAFLQILMRVTKTRQLIEVGTLGGYSAIAMARGMPEGGKILSLEIDDKHAAFAREWVAKSDVADRIEIRVGDARETMPTLPAASADAVFLDADKEGYVTYLEESMRILRSGGLLLADNVLAGGEVTDAGSTSSFTRSIRAFHEAVLSTGGLTAITVPLGDGCLLAVKD